MDDHSLGRNLLVRDRWITLPGQVERGHMVASGQAGDSPYPAGTILMQIPLFKERGLDLSPFYPATLNISIRPYTFQVVNPEHTFRRVEWTTRHPPEDFSFSRCRASFQGMTYGGWVYYPHPETKKRDFQSPSTVEVLAPFIPNLKYGDSVELGLNPDEIRVENR